MAAEIIDFTPHGEKNPPTGVVETFFAPLSEKKLRAPHKLFGRVVNSPFQISLQEKKQLKKIISPVNHIDSRTPRC
ncbi:MAG: hypothetical protein ACREQ2_18090 [Candidatus Binatia bacterium]